MGRFYSIILPETTISAAADLFEITAATDKPVRIWAFSLGQDTDLGDSAEEVNSRSSSSAASPPGAEDRARRLSP